DRPGERVKRALDLVAHGRRTETRFRGLPEEREARPQLVEDLVALEGGSAHVEAFDECRGPFEMIQHGAPSRFGRMRGEDGMDAELANDRVGRSLARGGARA